MSKTLTLAVLAKMTGAKLLGDPDFMISGVADLNSATLKDVSFISHPKYAKSHNQAFAESKAGAIFIQQEIADPSSLVCKNFLIAKDPSRAFQIALEWFFEELDCLTGFLGIHPTAVIHETVSLGKGVQIGPLVVIDRDVVLEDEVFIGASAYLGPGVKIGKQSIIHPRVVIRERSIIGKNVIIQPGAVIGSCGYGYATDEQGVHHKLKQLGNVVLEDEVEIGANTTIDRARFQSTRIGKGTKIDNLVQIAHGVITGKGCLLVSQTGIAGSSKLGNWVVMGGQVGVAGHISIADQAVFSAKSGVTKSILKPGKYGGFPAVSLGEHNRTAVRIQNLGHYVERITVIEKSLKEIKTSLSL